MTLYKLGILLCLYLVFEKFQLSLPKVQPVLANRKCKSINPYAHRKDCVILYILTTNV